MYSIQPLVSLEAPVMKTLVFLPAKVMSVQLSKMPGTSNRLGGIQQFHRCARDYAEMNPVYARK